jgi:hypothetical protein
MVTPSIMRYVGQGAGAFTTSPRGGLALAVSDAAGALNGAVGAG